MTFQEKTLQVNGSEMICITFGSGPRPFVLIAGMSMAGISGLGMGVSQAYAPLCGSHTVYLFDRIQPLPEGHSTLDMAEDIVCAMEQLGIRDADMMGASQGGMIAQLIAIHHPELVHTLVISSSMCTPNETAHATFREWLKLAQEKDIPAFNRSFYGKVYTPEFIQANQKTFDSLYNVGTEEQCRRFTVLAQAGLDFDIADQMDAIHCPTLVIGDKADRVLTGDASAEIAKRLNCELYLYDGYGHAVYDLAPDYKQRLLDFFGKHA